MPYTTPTHDPHHQKQINVSQARFQRANVLMKLERLEEALAELEKVRRTVGGSRGWQIDRDGWVRKRVRRTVLPIHCLTLYECMTR